MLNTLFLSIIIISVIIYSFIKVQRDKKDVFLGLYFGGMWSLMNILAHSDAGLIEQLESGIFILIFWFFYSFIGISLTEGYFNGLAKLTNTQPTISEDK